MTYAEIFAALGAKLPWSHDDDGILYDAAGEEVVYVAAVPDTRTAAVLAHLVVAAVNAAGATQAPEIPREGDLVRLARPPAPIDRPAEGGRPDDRPLGHGSNAPGGSAATWPLSSASGPWDSGALPNSTSAPMSRSSSTMRRPGSLASARASRAWISAGRASPASMSTLASAARARPRRGSPRSERSRAA